MCYQRSSLFAIFLLVLTFTAVQSEDSSNSTVLGVTGSADNSSLILREETVSNSSSPEDSTNTSSNVAAVQSEDSSNSTGLNVTESADNSTRITQVETVSNSSSPEDSTNTSSNVADTTLQNVTTSVESTANQQPDSTNTSDVTTGNSTETITVSPIESNDNGSTASNATAQACDPCGTESNSSISSISVTTTDIVPRTSAIVPAKICGENVDTFNNSSPCHPDNHKEISRDGLDESSCDSSLEDNEWLRFTADNTCQQIPMLTEGKCYKPGTCGTQFPYYLSGSSLPTSGSSQNYKLCTSDTLQSTNTISCCAEEINIDVYKCSRTFSVYRLKSKVAPTNACGRICTSETEKIKNELSVVSNGAALQKKFKDLKDEEKKSVVIIILELRSLNNFLENFENITAELVKGLEDELKAMFSKKAKRSTDSVNAEVDVLDGYPALRDDKVTYAILARKVTDDGEEPIGKRQVEQGVANLKKALPPSLEAQIRTIETTDVYPEDIQKYYPTDKTGNAQATSPEQSKAGNNLWIAIIIIIGITAFIVAVSFIAVWCYGFSRKGRTGMLNVSYTKEGLVGADELNNSYTPIAGHVNLAMEQEVDGNKNSKTANGDRNTCADSAIASMEENTV